MVPTDANGPKDPGAGAAKAENAEVPTPKAGEGRKGTPDTPKPAAVKKDGASKKEAKAKEAAAKKTEKLPDRELTEALSKVDFRAKELRAMGRTSGSFPVKLIETAGVKQALENRGWHIDRSADPLNYHVAFGK